MSAMNEQYVCKMCVKQSIKQGPRHSLSPQSITEVWEEQSEWERPAFDQSLTTLYYREITITHRGGGGGGEAVGGFEKERVKGINWINVRGKEETEGEEEEDWGGKKKEVVKRKREGQAFDHV